MHVCWGAQAALYHRYGIGKFEAPQKIFGVFDHEVLKPQAKLMSGFDERFELYFEDVDLCDRARAAGRVLLDTRAYGTHAHGASSRTVARPSYCVFRVSRVARRLRPRRAPPRVCHSRKWHTPALPSPTRSIGMGVQ